MKKRNLKILTVLLIGVIVVMVFFFLNDEKDIENVAAKDRETNVAESESKPKAQVVVPKSTLPMTTNLLPFSNSEIRVEPTTHIVLHFSSNAIHKPEDPYQVTDVYHILKEYGVSAHYIIDRSGEIHQLTYEDRVAYHAGEGIIQGYPEYNLGLNHYSIGIELLAIGTREEMIPIIDEVNFNKIDPSLLGYTEEQYATLTILINDIIERNPGISKNRLHVVGHDDYTDRKTDPGSLFDWKKIGL